MMNNTPDNEESRTGSAPAAGALEGAPQASAAPSGAVPADAGALEGAAPSGAARPPFALSPRVTAALAAGMLALGVAVGAAIGPAPSPSFAVGRLLPLLPSLLRAGERSSAPATSPPAIAAQATPSAEGESSSVARHRRKRRHGALAAESASTETSGAETPASETTTAPATTKTTSGAKTKASPLPPVSKVWLIELAGASFSEAASDASAAAYIDTSAVPSGALLSGYSALEAGALASDAALIAGSSPQLLDTIVQPPCPASSPEGEGAAGASCAAGTAGALSAADEFLKATLPAITSSAAYRENGLVVVTFASISSASAAGLPAGATTATLTSQPPAGALLISPFVKAGARSAATLKTTSPKQSLEQLLRR